MKKLAAFLTACALTTAIGSAAFCEEFRFPKDFIWGTALAAYQAEGGLYNNNWYEFEKVPGKILNGQKCGLACDHFNRYPGDFDLALALNAKAFRTSIEWSRIEPEEGKVDRAAVEHYRRYFAALRERGMTPMITLFHFSIPAWFAKKGGWTSKDAPTYFGRFAWLAAREFGDQVDFWTTHNEPMVYASAGYLNGMWPPGEKNPARFWAVLSNLIKGHAAAYRVIKAYDRFDADGDGKSSLVGFVTNYGLLEPFDPANKLNAALAEKLNYIANHALVDALVSGNIDHSSYADGAKRFRLPFLPAEPGTLDYICINYYTRARLKLSVTDPITGLGNVTRPKDGVIKPPAENFTDMGWEIYPEGMYTVMMTMKKYGLPLYVTENGIADSTGKKRTRFIADYLIQLKRAIDAGAPVKGYIHWSLMDNFEWAEGFRPRFGLYSVNFDTQKRTLTEGGAFYAEVCRNNGITEKMYEAVYRKELNKLQKASELWSK